MIYLTYSMIPSLDLACYRVSCAKDLAILEMCYNNNYGKILNILKQMFGYQKIYFAISIVWDEF